METINTAEISNMKVILNYWGSHGIEAEKW